VVGFVAYQLGFSTLQQQSTIAGSLAKAILQYIPDRELASFVLQMGGGLLAIAGLVITIWGATARAVGRIPVAVSPPPGGGEVRGTLVCKFCHAEMQPEEVFCPSCHRSQL